MPKYINLLKDENIGIITFNEPENLNALHPDAMKEITAAVEEMDNDTNIRTILFTGKGRAFSAGASYKFMDEVLLNLSPSEIKETIYKHFALGVKTIKMCSKPTVAAVNGPAVGTGCEVAIACDFRIVSESAVFKEIWIKLGIITPLGGMFLLPRLVGLGRATEMLMLGKPVNGKEAELIGLANKCVPDDKLMEAAMATARELAQGAPLALAAMKEGLRRGMESSLTAEWETNVFAQATLLSSEDFKEAGLARKENRKPKFQGK